MIARLRFALRELREAFRLPRRAASGERGVQGEVIKGTAGNVIIVKSPNTEVFKEAIFILRDDLFTRPGTNRGEVLQQARQAACAYVEAHTPERAAVPLLTHLLSFLLGALFSCALLLLFEI